MGTILLDPNQDRAAGVAGPRLTVELPDRPGWSGALQRDGEIDWASQDAIAVVQELFR
jgi:hypothetical protein